MSHFLKADRDRRGFLGIAAVLLVSVSLLGRAAEAQTSTAAQEEDICESVLRFQMQNWIRQLAKDEADAKNESDKAAADHYDFKIFFLEIKDKDPSDDFMGRFADIRRKLKKVSDSEVAKSMRMPAGLIRPPRRRAASAALRAGTQRAAPLAGSRAARPARRAGPGQRGGLRKRI
jgi:hypothetical protein